MEASQTPTCTTCGQPVQFDLWATEGNRWYHPGQALEPHPAAVAK